MGFDPSTLLDGVLILATAACASHHAAPNRIPAQPPCVQLYPLGLGARWTYNVDLVSGEGAASSQQHLQVTRVVRDATPLGADWRFTVDTTPLPADSALAATERYRLAGGNLYDADDSLADHLFLVPKPEQIAAWGGSRSFFPPGDGLWHVVDFEDAPPYHDCVKVHAQLKYGDVTHVYCSGVGPVASEYHERAPRSRTDPAVGHHRDERWRLRELTPGACTR